MSINVHPIATDHDQLSQYVQFPIDLYRDNACYVPPLVIDQIATLSPEGNPAFDFCEAQSFMAFDNGEPVGTITAIINRAANDKTGKKQMRFGFMDFIDSDEVVDSLFDAIAQWGRERGMKEMVGPVGFTDMDPEGMLIDGFDEMGTMATIYNFPYYVKHMERLGFVKDADWIEYRITIPDGIPEKHQRIGEIVARKYGLKVLKYTSRKKIRRRIWTCHFRACQRSLRRPIWFCASHRQANRALYQRVYRRSPPRGCVVSSRQRGYTCSSRHIDAVAF